MAPRRSLSEYRPVWLFAMFDLPVDTKEARKEYRQFRKELIARGFMMLQFSVYARYYANLEASRAHRGQLEGLLPPDGQVRLLAVTDRQFGQMDVFYGKTRESAEDPPQQLLLF
ncbi:MAG: CRISPR-associated endonuclease Cas2 [bacterium]